MVKNNLSVIINRPIEEVFAYVSDLEKCPQWQPGLVEVKSLKGGGPGVGSQYASTRKLFGQKLETVVEIVTYEPYSKMVIKSTSGASPFEELYLFESVNGGTKLYTEIEMNPSGIMGLAEPMIAKSLIKEMASDMGNLKTVLEQQVQVASI